MRQYIVPVDSDRVRIMKGVYHCFEHGILACYYVGYEDKDGNICRLTDVSREYADIKYKLKRRQYARRMTVTEYDNGVKIYTAVR